MQPVTHVICTLFHVNPDVLEVLTARCTDKLPLLYRMNILSLSQSLRVILSVWQWVASPLFLRNEIWFFHHLNGQGLPYKLAWRLICFSSFYYYFFNWKRALWATDNHLKLGRCGPMSVHVMWIKQSMTLWWDIFRLYTSANPTQDWLRSNVAVGSVCF